MRTGVRASSGLATGPTARAARLELLDYLRILAAFAVLCSHYFFRCWTDGNTPSTRPSEWFMSWAKYGYLGVELFFFISGFVILNSARNKTARQFLVSRCVRLFPAFWVALVLDTVFVALWGKESLLVVTTKMFLANLTMVGETFGQPFVNAVYWTLTVEVWFYLLVLFVLLIRRGHWLPTVFALWAWGLLALQLLHPSGIPWPFPGTWGQMPLTLGVYSLFTTGGLLAEARHSGWTPWRAAGVAAGLVGSLIAAVRRVGEIQAATPDYAYSRKVVFVVVLLAFCAVASMCFDRVASLRLPGSATMGALTYPLYLIHLNIGSIIITQLANPRNQWVMYLLVTAGMFLASWLLHVWVEKRPKRFWFKVFDNTVGRLAAVSPRT